MKLSEGTEQTREIWYVFNVKDQNIANFMNADLVKIGAELTATHKLSEEQGKDPKKYVAIILGVSFLTKEGKTQFEEDVTKRSVLQSQKD